MGVTFYATIAFALVVNLPLLLFLTIGLLGDVPGEWGIAAMCSYASMVLVFVAGAGMVASAPVVIAGMAVALAMAALITGGPYGLAIAALGLVLLTVLQLFADLAPFHWSLLVVASVLTAAGAARALLG